MNQPKPSTPSRKTKRKRGGQPGNQNARVHGFYSKSLSPAELCVFWNSINRNGVAPEIAVFNAKLHSLLNVAPDNRRTLKEAAKLLYKWYSAGDRLNKKDSRYLQKLIDVIVVTIGSHFKGNSVNEK